MGSGNDLVELSRQLKQERLFVSSEREQLQSLNEELSTSAQRLYHLAWITRQQRQNLEQLLRADKDATPQVCCERANDLDAVNFVDGYRQLSYHEAKIGECLKILRESPKVISACFVSAETSGREKLKELAQIVSTGLYGNAVMPEDENYFLSILKSLIELQVVPNDNPRHLLRKGKCSFCIFFKLLNEGLFSAKLFLTAAFHTPIMQLLMEDEWFYDIDPERALYRFPTAARIKRFGEPGTEEYERKTKEYREMTNNKLHMLTERFISSLQANMYCFPQSLAWLLGHLYKQLLKGGKCSEDEARALCADLIFIMFICPAICDPEPYGITTDTPISYIARHNLMQVATILQMLAISASTDDMDTKQRDLYAKFTPGCMNFLLDSILDQAVPEQPTCVTAYQLQNFHRAAVFMTMTELMNLLTFLRDVWSRESEEDDEDGVWKQLSNLLHNIPSSTVLHNLHHPRHLTPNSTPQPTPPGTPPTSARKLLAAGADMKRLLLTPGGGGGGDSGGATSASDDEDGTGGGNHRTLEDVLVISLGIMNDCPGMLHEQKVLAKEHKKKKGHPSTNSLIPGEDDPISESEINLNQKRTRFSLSHDQDSIATSDNLEAISEAASSHSVGSDLENEEDDNDNLSDFVSANVSGRGTPSISGRDTPLSQVESVISGPPDAPDDDDDADEEVVCAGGGQELQEEKQQEVVQDVANVDANGAIAGGRGGGVRVSAQQQQRQQPAGAAAGRQHQRGPLVANLPVIVHKQNREDVTERFGKFEIKQELERYETKSSVSDTWSTDVLASDSEPPDQNQLERLEEVAEEAMRQDLLGVHLPEGCGQQFQMTADVSETASDAWSTDVLASDTSEKQVERLLELEQDEMSSVSSRSHNVFDEMSSMSSRSHGGVFDDVSSVGSRSVGQSEQDEDMCSIGSRNDDTPQHAGSPAGSGRGLDDVHSAAATAAALLRTPAAARAGGHIIKSDRFSDSLLSRHTGAGASFNPPPRIPSQRPTSEVLDAFDPLLSSSDVLASSAVTLVGGEVVTSPDQGIASSTESVTTTTSLMGEHDGAVRGAASRPDSGVDELSADLADGLKLTDCQNVRIDAPRYSMEDGATGGPPAGTAFTALFDPLLSNTSSTTAAAAAAAADTQKHNHEGARPKVPPSTTPRISVNQPAGDGNKLSNGRGVGVLIDFDASGDQRMMSNDISSGGGGGGGGGRNRGTDTPDNNKDDAGDEKDKKKAASSGGGGGGGGGLLRSFKERFSKGGKRKLPQKPGGGTPAAAAEKDEAKLIDIEKGSGDPILAGSLRHGGHNSSEDLKARGASPAGGGGKANTVNTSLLLNDDSVFNESSDDILAKYRRPTSSPSKPTEAPDAASGNQSKEDQRDTTTPAYDPNNLENCKAFIDAKKKLRLVLCSGDLQASSAWLSVSGGRGDNELVLFLKAQLAESINLQDKDTIAQLHETIRCLRMFDSAEVKKLLRSMKDEYRQRAPYISYLVRCRQGLLSTIAHLDRLHNRVQREKGVVNKYFLSVFVRLFMEQRERPLNRFIAEFQRLNMPDEKTDLVEQFLHYMDNQIGQDPVWKAASNRQVDEARLVIERNVMSHIYTHAMFPNGDGDILRDKILHEHMSKLAAIITPSHTHLRIPAVYHYECPWPAAQAEIYMINAYKTPKDKLQCVWKCSQTIMNLLRLASDKSVPAADDFMPVLIYVLIKANPPNLLSTVQYVQSFYESRLHGEEQYWWVQFTAAIEFIKTID